MQKKKGKKEKTPTPTHLAQNGQTLKGQGKKKKRTDDGPKTARGGGGGQKRKARAKPTLPAKDPNLA